MFKVLMLFGVTLGCILTVVYGDCTIYANEAYPIFVRNFGFKKVIIPETSRIVLSEGEVLEAHCLSGVKISNRYNNHRTPYYSRSLKITCSEWQTIKVEILGMENMSLEMNLEEKSIHCEINRTPFLFERSTGLMYCEQFTSFMIQSTYPNITQDTIVEFCYDFDSKSVKFVNFIAYKNVYDFLKYQNVAHTSTVSLNQQIGDWELYFNTLKKDSFYTSFETLKAKNQPLLQLFDFEYDSIVQETAIRASLDELKEIFNIVWWTNLRQFNWMHYLNALSARTIHARYNVTLGVSGELVIPTERSDYQEMEILKIKTSKNVIKVSKYIWAYLKLDHPSEREEFVVIAYNSPFVYWPAFDGNSDPVIFCEDICDKYEWLHSSIFGKTRLISAFGVMFCCRPEDVRRKFDDFPSDFPEE